MERSTIFNGKIHYKWSFSIAMLNYQRVSISSKTNDDFSGVHRSHLMFVHVCADSETARHQLANSRGLRDGDWTWFHGREFLQISPDSRWIYPRCTTRFSETLDFDGFWVAMGSLFDNPTLSDPLAIMAVDVRQGPQDLQSQSSGCRGPYACHMGCLSSISKIGSSNPPKQDHTGDTTKG